MSGARHHVVLNHAYQGFAYLAQMVGVLAIAFLRHSPPRVAQQVDARSADHVGPMGASFSSQGIGDWLLEFGIRARPRNEPRGKVVAPSWKPFGPFDNLIPRLHRQVPVHSTPKAL